MVKICKVKIDSRGRLSLPMSFLKANNIKEESYVTVMPVAGSKNIKLQFQHDDSDLKERKKKKVMTTLIGEEVKHDRKIFNKINSKLAEIEKEINE